MSAVTIVGVVITFALVVCVLAFLGCFAFASSSGRHALGVPREGHVRPIEDLELGDVISGPIEPEIVDQYGVGLGFDDEYPSDSIGARPYFMPAVAIQLSPDTVTFRSRLDTFGPT
jgi:hypothetical protein